MDIEISSPHRNGSSSSSSNNNIDVKRIRDMTQLVRSNNSNNDKFRNNNSNNNNNIKRRNSTSNIFTNLNDNNNNNSNSSKRRESPVDNINDDVHIDRISSSLSSIKTAVRIRPQSMIEIEKGERIVMRISDIDGEIYAMEPMSEFLENKLHQNRNERKFAYNHAFDQLSSQTDIYEKIGLPLVNHCISGYNSALLAYGQTGSGKTHTMLGDDDELNRGIIPRVAIELIALIQDCYVNDNIVNSELIASFFEIYNEKVYDLLSNENMEKSNCKVREHPQNGAYCPGLKKIPVTNINDISAVLELGKSNRSVFATNMNAFSSRSHAVFVLYLNQEIDSSSLPTTTTPSTSTLEPTKALIQRKSKITCVDLAGSERVSNTLVKGDRLTEAKNINLSLSTLGDVIKALSEKSTFAPFRNSTLTWLLKDSIGGNSKTTMIATVTPNEDGYQESISTLKYIERAKLISQKAVVNDVQTDQSTILMLRDQMKLLQKEYDDYRLSSSISQINDDELIKCKNEIERLKEEIDRLNMIIDTFNHGLVADANMLILSKERDRLRDAFNSKMAELDKLDELLENEQKTNKDLSSKLIQQNEELLQAKSDNESINNELNYTYDELDKYKEQYEAMIEELEENFSNLMVDHEEKHQHVLNEHKSKVEEVELRRALQYVELNRKLETVEVEHQEEIANLKLKISNLKKNGVNGHYDNNDDSEINTEIMNVLSLVHLGLQRIEGQCLDLSSRTDSSNSPRQDNDTEFFETPQVPTITNAKMSHTVTGIFSKQKSIFELIHNLFRRVFLRSPINLPEENLSPSSQHSDNSYDMNTLSQSLVNTKVQLAELHSDNLELQFKYSNLEKYCCELKLELAALKSQNDAVNITRSPTRLSPHNLSIILDSDDNDYDT